MTRTYADGIEDAARVADAEALAHSDKADSHDRHLVTHCTAKRIAAAIRAIPTIDDAPAAMTKAVGALDNRLWSIEQYARTAGYAFLAAEIEATRKRELATLSTSPSGIDDATAVLAMREAAAKVAERVFSESLWDGAFYRAGSTIAEKIRALPTPSAPSDAREALTGVVSEIAAERRRQIEAEGWTPEHDDEHRRGELADAAACYAHGELIQDEADGNLWPWHEDWWKPKGGRCDLIRAGALIVAEIERLDRATLPESASSKIGGDHG